MRDNGPAKIVSVGETLLGCFFASFVSKNARPFPCSDSNKHNDIDSIIRTFAPIVQILIHLNMSAYIG